MWYRVIRDRRWQNANVQSHLRRNILAAGGKWGRVSSGWWLCSQSEATPLSENTETLAGARGVIRRTVKMLTGPARWSYSYPAAIGGTPHPLLHPHRPSVLPFSAGNASQALNAGSKISDGYSPHGAKKKKIKICAGKWKKWGRVGVDRLQK